ncbi:hypothetical protein PIB30_005004 [Stylosanthes scabra]|uniref:Uncharacterized protein n=1 Tax=Stylosanthes scabra TaxID=79078 RepID=A0ABU6Y403_9FABA|nr:hypothetical protein [Stylosanthes scabra]
MTYRKSGCYTKILQLFQAKLEDPNGCVCTCDNEIKEIKGMIQELIALMKTKSSNQDSPSTVAPPNLPCYDAGRGPSVNTSAGMNVITENGAPALGEGVVTGASEGGHLLRGVAVPRRNHDWSIGLPKFAFTSSSRQRRSAPLAESDKDDGRTLPPHANLMADGSQRPPKHPRMSSTQAGAAIYAAMLNLTPLQSRVRFPHHTRPLSFCQPPPLLTN